MKLVLGKQALAELIERAKASGDPDLLRGVQAVVHEVKVLRYKQTLKPSKTKKTTD